MKKQNLKNVSGSNTTVVDFAMSGHSVHRFTITQGDGSSSSPDPAPCRYWVNGDEVCREAFCAIRDTVFAFHAHAHS